jgi:phosphoglycerate dehydrogenase-like enzyme
MAPIAIVFGVLLALLGPALYLLSDPEKQSPTAFIPSGFGIVLIVFGVIARNEKFRMHAMHGAALIGLIGFGVPAYMVSAAWIRGVEFVAVKHGGQATMAELCLLFVGMCMGSFIQARIARKQTEAETPPAQ